MKRKRILLVEDDETLVTSFQMILQKGGYHVETTTTGQQALERAKKTDFQLAILDISLPDIQGPEVASHLKKQDDNIGLVFITGHPTFNDCIQALDIGIDEILLKPIGANELLRVTKETLSRKKNSHSRAHFSF